MRRLGTSIMNLLEFRARLGREIGLNPAVDSQQEALDELINAGASELWETDLPRSLMEMTVQLDGTINRVTVPAAVGEIRAMRDSFSKLTLHDRRPRYANWPWPKADLRTFRLLAERPTERSIDNTVPLYMVPVTMTGDVTVTIAGRTADANEVHGTFDKTGAGSAATILWEEIYYITKDAVTPVDVVLRSGDASGDEMARLWSHMDRALYLEFELIETPYVGCTTAATPARCIDVLYKPHFRPLLEDTASFQLAGYDNAIIYRAIEIYRLRGTGADQTPNQLLAARAARAKADELVDDKIQNAIQGEELIVQFGKPKGDARLLRGLRNYRYGRYRNSSSYRR